MIQADLGQHLEDLLDDLIASGRYQTKDDVLREGVRLVQQRDAHMSDIDQAIQRGLDDVEAKRVRPAAHVFDDLEAKYKAMVREP